MRRGVGIGAIKKKQDAEARFKEKGSELASEQLEQLSTNLEQFRASLEEFAVNHRHEIKRDPKFRQQFQEMCASIGVDPLASGKGFWAEKLGVGDFYYELGVQIVEICLATAHTNGGIITITDLRQRLRKSRNKARKDEITNDDILRAIEKLKCLGSGFKAIKMTDERNDWLIQSVPGELNMDHTRLLELAQDSGRTNVKEIVTRLGWTSDRAQHTLDQLTKDGLVWVDTQTSLGSGALPDYWFPGFFKHEANKP